LLEWYDFAVYALFVVVVCACGLMAASFSGVAPTTLSGLFPTSVRATGVSLAYNAGFTLFGGFAPAILTWFTATGAGSVYAPAWFVMLAAIPALIALRFEARHRSATAAIVMGSV
jgi:MHS family proline/betaine transporter-like MFS transporter